MTDSPIGTLAAALAAAQAEVSNATKDRTNPAFKSHYATLASVTDAVRPVFARHGVAIVQDAWYEGGCVYCTTILMHGSGETWTSRPLSAPVGKQDAQGVGSALTYVRRYALMAVACVAPEDDDGEAAVGRNGAWGQAGGKQDPKPAPTPAARPAAQPKPAPQPQEAKPAGEEVARKIDFLKRAGILTHAETALGVSRGWNADDVERIAEYVARVAKNVPDIPLRSWLSDDVDRAKLIAVARSVGEKAAKEAEAAEREAMAAEGAR